MSEAKTDVEILALLTAEFPPSKGEEWAPDFYGHGYCRDIAGHKLRCIRGGGGWIVERAKTSGYGADIPAAIHDFRAKVAAEAVVVGAVKVAPAPKYNEVETAIYAHVFAGSMMGVARQTASVDDWHAAAPHAITAAHHMVEIHRAAFK